MPEIEQFKALMAQLTAWPLAAFISFMSGPWSEGFGWRGYALDPIIKRFGISRRTLPHNWCRHTPTGLKFCASLQCYRTYAIGVFFTAEAAENAEILQNFSDLCALCGKIPPACVSPMLVIGVIGCIQIDRKPG